MRGGANTYGGKDSWDDYDNSNTRLPSSGLPPKGKILSRYHSAEGRQAAADRYRADEAESITDAIVRKGGT